MPWIRKVCLDPVLGRSTYKRQWSCIP